MHLCSWAELPIEAGWPVCKDLRRGSFPAFWRMENDVEKDASRVGVVACTRARRRAVAQQQTGEIYGRAADTSGAVLPGATVTVAGPALIQPRVAVTSETGTYRDARAADRHLLGDVRARRLPAPLALQDIRVTIGFRAQVNGALELSTVQETVTVTGASPLVDTRETGTKSTFDLETMQNIPSARDPWVMLETHARHHHGPRQRRRQPVGPAGRLHLARRHRPATTSGLSTASMSPTCRPPDCPRCTTTSTCSRRCRSRLAARTSRSRPAASASISSRAAAAIASARARAAST